MASSTAADDVVTDIYLAAPGGNHSFSEDGTSSAALDVHVADDVIVAVFDRMNASPPKVKEYKLYRWQDLHMEIPGTSDSHVYRTVITDTRLLTHEEGGVFAASVTYERQQLPVCCFPCTADVDDERYVRHVTLRVDALHALCFESYRSPHASARVNTVYVRRVDRRKERGDRRDDGWGAVARTLTIVRDVLLEEKKEKGGGVST